MSDHHFWLTEAQFSRLRPLLPNKPRGVPRVDDQRVISSIIHVIQGRLICRSASAAHGPHNTLYNRFMRWSRAGVFDRIFATLAAESVATDPVMIGAGPLKAHRTTASLVKKGLFPAVFGRSKAALTPSCTPSVTAMACH
jgi:transposase